MRSTLRALTGAGLTAGLLAVSGGVALAADTYEVQSGDTLSSIARDHGIDSWQELAELNDLADPDRIQPGQVLALTADGQGDATPASTSSSGVDDTVWDRLAECESGGDWSINTGNGYYGGLQFLPSSWEMAGGTGMPHEASRETQIEIAENLLEIQGWGAWPACSSQLGLR